MQWKENDDGDAWTSEGWAIVIDAGSVDGGIWFIIDEHGSTVDFPEGNLKSIQERAEELYLAAHPTKPLPKHRSVDDEWFDSTTPPDDE